MILYQTKAFVWDNSKLKMSAQHFTKFVKYFYFLSESKPLPPEARDHERQSEWPDFREFHVSGDLLVIYQIEGEVTKLVRIGTHNQLFKE